MLTDHGMTDYLPYFPVHQVFRDVRAFHHTGESRRLVTHCREKSVAAGASDYIAKPVDTDQLLSLMRVWLYR